MTISRDGAGACDGHTKTNGGNPPQHHRVAESDGQTGGCWACSRSLATTKSGTRPVTSPPCLATSLTRLELRYDQVGLVAMKMGCTPGARRVSVAHWSG